MSSSAETSAPNAAAEDARPVGERQAWGEVKKLDQCKFPWCDHDREVKVVSEEEVRAGKSRAGQKLGFCDQVGTDGRRLHTAATAYAERKRLMAEQSGTAAPATSEADQAQPYESARMSGAALLQATKDLIEAEKREYQTRMARLETLVERVEVVGDPSAADADVETAHSTAAEEVARAKTELGRETRARISAEEKLAIAEGDRELAEAAITEFEAEKAQQLEAAAAETAAANSARDAALAGQQEAEADREAKVSAALAEVQSAQAAAEAATRKAEADIAAARAEAEAKVAEAQAAADARVQQANTDAEAKVVEAQEVSRRFKEANDAALQQRRQELDAEVADIKAQATEVIAEARLAQNKAENDAARAEASAAAIATAAENARQAHVAELERLQTACDDKTEAISQTARTNLTRAERAEAEIDRLRDEIDRLRTTPKASGK